MAGRADHPRGIGNGISLIIFAGIVAGLPAHLRTLLVWSSQGPIVGVHPIVASIVAVVVVIAFIVFMERAQRRLLIQYPKRAR